MAIRSTVGTENIAYGDIGYTPGACRGLRYTLTFKPSDVGTGGWLCGDYSTIAGVASFSIFAGTEITVTAFAQGYTYGQWHTTDLSLADGVQSDLIVYWNGVTHAVTVTKDGNAATVVQDAGDPNNLFRSIDFHVGSYVDNVTPQPCALGDWSNVKVEIDTDNDGVPDATPINDSLATIADTAGTLTGFVNATSGGAMRGRAIVVS